MEKWNNGAIAQDEEICKTKLEAVDVHGYDPSGSGLFQTPDKRVRAGIQTPAILKLRTCVAHRMRLMLTHNLDVGNSCVNGTRCRLLASRAWTIGTQMRNLRRGAKGWEAEQVDLRNKHQYPEFNMSN